MFTAIADKVYSSSLEYHDNYNLIVDKSNSLPQVKYGSASETCKALKKMRIKYDNESEGSDWLVAVNEGENVSLKQRKINQSVVPDVTGMPLNDAVYLLENFGLRVKVQGDGKIMKQSQNPGAELIKGTTIKLFLK